MNSAPQDSRLHLVQQHLQTVKTLGFFSIDHILTDSFKCAVLAAAEQIEQQPSLTDSAFTMLHRLTGTLNTQTQVDNSPNLQEHLQLLSVLLYGNINYKQEIKKLGASFKPMGVCAKVMKLGDVAWKCEDCEKDSTCIICDECFKKSDHTGHRVWLKTHVGGCCDCGDPDAWDEKGFCTDHQGFAASTDSMLKALPAYLKESSPHCFGSLSNQLKELLISAQSNFTAQRKQQVGLIVRWLADTCKELPSNIYFISKALTQIHLGMHQRPDSHTCNHRYFISDADKETFYEQFRQFDQKAHLCTCSTLDMLFQTSTFLDKKTGQILYDLFFTLFQTYEFKQALAMTYIANLSALTTKITDDDKSLLSIGVQLLTAEPLTIQIMKEPALRSQIINTNVNLWKQLVKDPQSNQKRWLVNMLAVDLKYMARPGALKMIIRETDFIEQLIRNMAVWHYNDCAECPQQMQPFDDTTPNILARADMEGKVLKNIQKYLDIIETPEDVEKILQVFDEVLEELNQERLQKYLNKGFFSVPVLRLFSYFVTRLKLRQVVTRQAFQVADRLVSNSIQMLAHHSGFLAEIKARVWVYKGEQYSLLPSFHNEQLSGSLPDIGLLQTLITLQPQCIEIFIENFGTHQTMAPLQRLLRQDQIEIETLGQVVNPEKLGLLIQQFLTRLVQIAIFETSLINSSKHLFKDSPHKEAFTQFLGPIMERELIHNLFMQTSAPVDRILKESDKLITNDPLFMPTLLKITNSQVDQQGRKTFRLKDEYLKKYDPYLYLSEKQFTMQNAAYSHQRTNTALNNIVGDYKHHHHYASEVNRQCWSALAQSHRIRYFVTALISDFLQKGKLYQSKVVTLQSFSLALKLQLLILESNEDSLYLKHVKESLPSDLLKAQDDKLNEILGTLNTMLNVGVSDVQMSEIPVQPQVNQQMSKESMLQKKQAMIAKMKQKQQQFIQNQVQTDKSTSQQAVLEETKDQITLNCAACQEVLTLQSYDQRPFVQLGYAQRSKLLFHAQQQTNAMRKNAFITLARAYGHQLEQPVDESKSMSLGELQKWEDKQMLEFGLDGVVDQVTKCGVQLNRCCHYFHMDCLEQYITADKKKTYQQSYVANMIGLDDSMIQCPLCKGITNAYQPLLPCSQETKSLQSHIDFLGMMITAQKRDAKQILQVDIVKSPEEFLQSIMEFTAYQLHVLSTYRPQEMFQLFDPLTPSNTITLRDLVYILKSAFEVTRRSQQEFQLSELAQILIECLQTMSFTENPLEKNHTKVVTQLMFCAALKNADDSFIQMVIDSVYSGFKAQVAVMAFLEAQFKPWEPSAMVDEVTALMRKTELSDNVISMQLQFLRVASCMKLIAQALRSQEMQGQLGIDCSFLAEMKSQIDNRAEFFLLSAFLNLDTSFESIYSLPASLNQQDSAFEDDDCIRQAILGVTSLSSDLESQLKLLMQKSAQIPAAMNLLMPSGTFSLTQLPSDFQTLVREYYQKQCRNCRKQLQTNAICLLCGEIVCFMPQDKCCQSLPGMQQHKSLHALLGTDSVQTLEGELTYHARHWEGGCSAFLLPSTSQVICIDNGRIAEFDSFYRSDVGGTFNQNSSQKWENFFCNESTGGAIILQTLKKELVQGELPNKILQERTRKQSVIRRNIY